MAYSSSSSSLSSSDSEDNIPLRHLRRRRNIDPSVPVIDLEASSSAANLVPRDATDIGVPPNPVGEGLRAEIPAAIPPPLAPLSPADQAEWEKKVTSWGPYGLLDERLVLHPTRPAADIRYYTEDGRTACFWICHFRAGMRIPFHGFIRELLLTLEVPHFQLTSNAWRIAMCFLIVCTEGRWTPTLNAFFTLFRVTKRMGMIYFQSRGGKTQQPFNIPNNAHDVGDKVIVTCPEPLGTPSRLNTTRKFRDFSREVLANCPPLTAEEDRVVNFLRSAFLESFYLLASERVASTLGYHFAPDPEKLPRSPYVSLNRMGNNFAFGRVETVREIRRPLMEEELAIREAEEQAAMEEIEEEDRLLSEEEREVGGGNLSVVESDEGTSQENGERNVAISETTSGDRHALVVVGSADSAALAPSDSTSIVDVIPSSSSTPGLITSEQLQAAIKGKGVAEKRPLPRLPIRSVRPRLGPSITEPRPSSSAPLEWPSPFGDVSLTDTSTVSAQGWVPFAPRPAPPIPPVPRFLESTATRSPSPVIPGPSSSAAPGTSSSGSASSSQPSASSLRHTSVNLANLGDLFRLLVPNEGVTLAGLFPTFGESGSLQSLFNNTLQSLTIEDYRRMGERPLYSAAQGCIIGAQLLGQEIWNLASKGMVLGKEWTKLKTQIQQQSIELGKKNEEIASLKSTLEAADSRVHEDIVRAEEQAAFSEKDVAILGERVSTLEGRLAESEQAKEASLQEIEKLKKDLHDAEERHHRQGVDTAVGVAREVTRINLEDLKDFMYKKSLFTPLAEDFGCYHYMKWGLINGEDEAPDNAPPPPSGNDEEQNPPPNV